MTTEILLFIGAPGSGKSTFFRQRFAATHVHISRDLFRNNGNPTRRQRQLIEEALAAGHSIVVDNTHPTKKDRGQVLDLARARSVPVDAYVFDSVAKECLARNAAREGKARVPAVAIYTWLKRFEAPSFDEGFRAVFDVKLDGAGGFSVVTRAAAGRVP